MMAAVNKLCLCILSAILTYHNYQAQFLDEFISDSADDWTYFAGDGNLEMSFINNSGYAEVIVDAEKDTYNVWWALIKRNITSEIDMHKLALNDHELRIEAKVKTKFAPKRINLHANTNRTTDFHSNLMEFEIPDTSEWHIVSMTTENFDVMAGDSVNIQLALMDWGIGKYTIELDYIKADVIKNGTLNNAIGNSIPYHPKIPLVSTFSHHLSAAEAAMISSKYKDENFYGWQISDNENTINILTLSGEQLIILKWDLSTLIGSRIKEHGLLGIKLKNYYSGNFSLEELSQIRLVEIIGGDPNWTSKSVSFNSFTKANNLSTVINTQPVYDLNPESQQGPYKYFTVSSYVLQRLIDGKSFGLALLGLGPIIASIDLESGSNPKLHFDCIENN